MTAIHTGILREVRRDHARRIRAALEGLRDLVTADIYEDLCRAAAQVQNDDQALMLIQTLTVIWRSRMVEDAIVQRKPSAEERTKAERKAARRRARGLAA